MYFIKNSIFDTSRICSSLEKTNNIILVNLENENEKLNFKNTEE